MSKPHAHLQTMNKTPTKFQKDQDKMLGGVVLTKYPPIVSDMLKSLSCAGAILKNRPVCYGTSRLKSRVCAVTRYA